MLKRLSLLLLCLAAAPASGADYPARAIKIVVPFAPGGGTPPVSILSHTDRYGTYNLTDGTQGPFWAYQGIWNTVTKSYHNCTTVAGSTTITGFADVDSILVGMNVYTYPVTLPNAPWPTVISIDPIAKTIEISAPATLSASNNLVSFGLLNDGVMYSQEIVAFPDTFPNETEINWSWPAQMNDARVYSYPSIIIGTDAGWFTPTNMPPAKVLSDFTDLHVNFNIEVDAGINDFDCLIETTPVDVANPPHPVGSYRSTTNEIGFLAHTPDFLRTYILSLASHFDYSANGFNAYIATRPGTPFTSNPPFTMIMPVDAPGSTTALDLLGADHSFPVKDVFTELIARGILPADSFITGFLAGFETARNSGSAKIHKLEWVWN